MVHGLMPGEVSRPHCGDMSRLSAAECAAYHHPSVHSSIRPPVHPCCMSSLSPLTRSVTRMCGCTTSSRSGSLVPYVILMVCSVILAIVLRYSGGEFVHLYYQYLHNCQSARCVGYGAVFRVSFATFTFFLTHAILLLFTACALVDRFSWCNKILYWLSLLVISYLLPEEFYSDFYVHVARVVGGFFLFLQIVILIDMAHSVNEAWNSREEPIFKGLIIGCSLACLIASGVLLGLYYHWFGGTDCRLNQFFISFTLCGTFLLVAISITEKFSEKGGLLPASIVTIYCYWLCFSGLASDPSTCNSLGGQQETLQLVLGLILATASIGYAGYSVGTHHNLFGVEEEAAAKNIEDKAVSAIELGDIDADRDAAHARALSVEVESRTADERLVARRNLKFHFVMATCSMYMAMLLTNWGSTDIAHDIEVQDGQLTGTAYDLSRESMWIKFASQWVTMTLFGWSVVAPVILKNRDFS